MTPEITIKLRARRREILQQAQTSTPKERARLLALVEGINARLVSVFFATSGNAAKGE